MVTWPWTNKKKIEITGQKYNGYHKKPTFTNEKQRTTTQNKHKKTKARFSCLLRHPAWKWIGTIPVLVLYKFVTYSLRHLSLTYSPGPTAELSPQCDDVQMHLSAGKQNCFPAMCCVAVFFIAYQQLICLQCFDTVGWASGIASSL